MWSKLSNYNKLTKLSFVKHSLERPRSKKSFDTWLSEAKNEKPTKNCDTLMQFPKPEGNTNGVEAWEHYPSIAELMQEGRA